MILQTNLGWVPRDPIIRCGGGVEGELRDTQFSFHKHYKYYSGTMVGLQKIC